MVIETVRFTDTHVIVEYMPPIRDPKLLAELEAYWHERIERILLAAMCPAGVEVCHRSLTLPKVKDR